MTMQPKTVEGRTAARIEAPRPMSVPKNRRPSRWTITTDAEANSTFKSSAASTPSCSI